MKPWTKGYVEYKEQEIERALGGKFFAREACREDIVFGSTNALWSIGLPILGPAGCWMRDQR
jgi:hypothetical protein